MPGNIADEKARLKARLAELEAAEKAEREKQEKIAGRVALKEADADPAFAEQLRSLLDRHLTGKRERAAFGLEGRKPAASKSPATGSEPNASLSGTA